MRGPSLLTRFGVTSALLLAALGLVLSHALGGAIKERALAEAVEQSALITRLGVQPLIEQQEFEQGLSPDRAIAVDKALNVQLASSEVLGVVVWNRYGGVIYANRLAVVEGLPPEFHRALRGERVVRLVDVSDSDLRALRRHGQVLRVYVPVFLGSMDGTPSGVVRTTLPYEPIDEAIVHDIRQLYLLLAGGLLVLYAVLFRLVAGASRRLRQQAAENEHQALHDALTGLPNRTLFMDRVQQAIVAAARHRARLAVVLMDLDRFKEVNDTLGHYHGDALLRQIAARLRSRLRTTDTIARLGGDEFGILLTDLAEPDDAARTANLVRAALNEPIEVERTPLEVGASLGIARYPEHGEDAETLLRRADVAMYTAKNKQLGVVVYSPERDGHSRDRLALAGELRTALQAGQFVLHYQPEVDLRTGAAVAAEALVRWEHPVHGLLDSEQFIPLVERTDLVCPLTTHVLDSALRQRRAWADEGVTLGVAVNLSVRNLHDLSLPATIASLLDRRGVEPGALTLEITETTITADPVRAGGVLAELRALGVRLAIDDFGYSSLAVLRSLSVQALKIDRTFLGGDELRDELAVVRFSIQLAHSLGLRVVATGVDDPAVVETLTAMGCDLAQGEVFSPPVPPGALPKVCRELGGVSTSGP